MGINIQDDPKWIAYDTCVKVMKENAEKYPDEPWKNISSKEHIHHAFEHLDTFNHGYDMSDPRFNHVDSLKEELEHALTRISMALIRLRQETEPPVQEEEET